MAEKDLSERALEAYDDVFADNVNGLLFAGKQVVEPGSLRDAAATSMYKASDELHELERDISKWWMGGDGRRVSVRIALLGIENQTEYDKDMPLRVMGYDGAAYRAELLQGEDVKARYPVVTLVLHFGATRWGKARSLLDVLNVPEPLTPYVSNYHISVFDISFLTEEQLGYFKSDFAVVADYFVHRRDNPDYRPTNPPAFEHVDELLKLLSVMTRDDRFVMTLDGPGEVPRNMCEVLDRVEQRGIEQGIERGIEQGIEQGMARSVLGLMRTTGWSAEQAMEAIGVPPEKRLACLAILAKEGTPVPEAV